MKTAAAYLRVSTEAQDEYSLDSQLKLIRSYAASHDMVVPDEFVFTDDGISGRSAKKRPEFQRMIGWAKEKDRPWFGVADSPFRGYISGASQEDHIAVYPPSTGRLTPVTYAEFFEARNRVAVSSSPSSP